VDAELLTIKQSKEMKTTIENVKSMTLDGNRMVVETEGAWEPKDGDVCTNAYGSVFIFKYADSECAYFYVWMECDHGRIDFLATHKAELSGIRPAPDNLQQKLFDRLKRDGKYWDAQSKRIRPIKETFIPMDGDFCADKDGNLFIFKEWSTGWSISVYAGLVLSSQGLFINSPRFTPDVARRQTGQEKALLLDKLRQSGKRWNAEGKQVEEIGLDRTMKKEYWFIGSDGRHGSEIDCGLIIDNDRFELGNYFHSKKEADDFFKNEIEPIYKKRK
jgi:hypothetical protein